MDSLTYHLQSLKDKTIEVPRNYATIAQNAIEVIDQVDTIEGAVGQVPSRLLINPGILSTACNYISNRGKPSEAKFHDELYLRICMRLSESREDNPNPEEAFQFERGLHFLISQLN